MIQTNKDHTQTLVPGTRIRRALHLNSKNKSPVGFLVKALILIRLISTTDQTTSRKVRKEKITMRTLIS